MTVIKDFRELPSAARQLLFASGVNSLGSGLVLPLLVVYLVQAHGFDVSVATEAVALTSVTAFLGGLVAGWALDVVGRFWTILSAMVVAAAGTCLYALVSAPWQALLAAAVFGLGVGGNSVWQALLAEAVEPDQRPVVFGLNFGISNAGLGIGGIVAGSVVATSDLWTFRTLYLINGLTFVVAGWLMVTVSKRLPQPGGGDRDKDGPRASYRSALGNRPLLAALLVAFLLFTLGYSQLESGVPAVLVTISDLHAADLAKVFFVDTVIAVLAQVTLLSVIKRLPPRISLAIAALSWSVFWALLLLAPRLHSETLVIALACVGAAIASVGAAFYSAVVPTLVNAAATHANRGRVNALYGIAVSAGFTLGPALAGLFVGNGMTMLFVGIGLAMGVVVALLSQVLAFPTTDRAATDRAATEQAVTEEGATEQGTAVQGSEEPAEEPVGAGA
ncbi:MFS transporter [Kitasatospora sp. NPDC056138]|uniref:MFS transporter n=1 Tax=Kitasatospora sp. NPDC056138 TaxID=3345724 RepID=UPI0035D5CB47